MKIFINNNELKDLEPFSDYNHLIRYVEEKSGAEGKVISEIIVDGIEIYELETLEDRAFQEEDVIEFTTKEPYIIFLESLNEMTSYLDRLKTGVEKIIDELANENEREAMQIVIDAINGFEWIYGVFSAGTNALGIDYEEIEFDGIYAKYENILAEIADSLENRDNILLADLLNYELLDIIQEIKDRIPDIYKYVSEKNDKINH